MSQVTKVLLTINLEGGLTGAVSNAGSKKEKQRMKKSTFWNGKGPLPKGYYHSQEKYNERPQTTCIQKVKVSEDNYRAYVEPIPKEKNETKQEAAKRVWWNKLEPKQRLEFHLREICQALGGKSYTYEVID